MTDTTKQTKREGLAVFRVTFIDGDYRELSIRVNAYSCQDAREIAATKYATPGFEVLEVERI